MASNSHPTRTVCLVLFQSARYAPPVLPQKVFDDHIKAVNYARSQAQIARLELLERAANVNTVELVERLKDNVHYFSITVNDTAATGVEERWIVIEMPLY